MSGCPGIKDHIPGSDHQHPLMNAGHNCDQLEAIQWKKPRGRHVLLHGSIQQLRGIRNHLTGLRRMMNSALQLPECACLPCTSFQELPSRHMIQAFGQLWTVHGKPSSCSALLASMHLASWAQSWRCTCSLGAINADECHCISSQLACMRQRTMSRCVVSLITLDLEDFQPIGLACITPETIIFESGGRGPHGQ